MTDAGQAPAPPPVTWEAPASPGTPTTSGDAQMASSDIFQRAIWIYQRGFVVLAMVAAVVQVPLAIVTFVLGGRVVDAFAPLRALGQNSTPTDVQTAFQNAFGAASPSIGAIGLISFVAGLLLSPALIATTARLHAGTGASVGDAYGKALGAALSILVGSIVQGLALFAVFVAIVLASIIVAVVLQNDGGLAALSIFVGFVVAVVAAVYLAIRWSVWTPAVVLEGRGPIDALRRSWGLVKGNMWRSLAILFVTGLVAAVAGAVLGAVGGAVGGAISPGAGALVGDLLAILTVSWFPIVLTLLFLDLRARRGEAALAATPPEATWPTAPAEMPPG
jgi:hypothetical protein